MKMMMKSIVNPYCLDEYSSYSACPYYRSVLKSYYYSSKFESPGSCFSSCWSYRVENSFCWNETW